ncbi:MAG: aminotransferase class V-fold PLP-dependent enzyme [Gemmatimonadota bacterium]
MIDGRAAFDLPAGVRYLNCAYMSPLPRVVAEAGRAGIERQLDPSRITAPDFFEEPDAVRRAFARLVDTPEAAAVAIIPAASYGIGTVAANVDVSAGQNLVLTAEQFPSNAYPWRSLARRRGAEVRAVAPPPSGVGRAAAWNAEILAAIDEVTAVVAVPAFHWTDGSRFDLAAVGDRAREVGALFVVDGSQSVGAVPFSVREIAPDALVCVGYKWLLGPYSIGVAWFGERLVDGRPLEETWISRPGSEDFRRVADYRDELRPGADRFDVGERANFTLVPMLRAALELVLTWSPGAIEAYCESLTADFCREVVDLGIEVEDPAWRAAHLVGLRLPAGIDIDGLHRELTRRRIHVALRGSALRVSPHLYNDPSDLEALREVLRAACRRDGSGG